MSVNIVVPELGESVLEATVGEWLKQEGESVEAGEALVELETDKVNLEVSAPQSGVLAKIERRSQEDVHVGDVLGTIEPSAAGEGSSRPPQPAREQAPTPQAEPAPVAQPAPELTPVARRFAEEQGIDTSQVKGSGPGGRVTRTDLVAFTARTQDASSPGDHQPSAPTSPEQKPEPPSQPSITQSSLRGEERIKMSRRRRTIASRLVEAQQTAAILSTFNEVDMSAVMDLRKRRGEDFQKRTGVKLGFMSFFVKASLGALKVFPQINAEIQGDEIVIKHYYDIGIAIGADDGLVVPVLGDADRLSFAEIERRINDFAEKTRQGTLSLDDLRGGTFTITNGGVFGSLLSTPILSPPQVGILGMHKIEKRPVVIGDEIAVRPMMYLALSYDHRIVDGREAVQFLVRIKELLEDPESMLLEG